MTDKIRINILINSLSTYTMHTEHLKIIQQLSECANECNHCYSECLHEKDVAHMILCIQFNRDCADICQFTASMLARGSAHAQHLLKECVDVCNACAQECAKHMNEHCKLCAEICSKCAETCNAHTTGH
jgi:hypothetical protein